MKQRQWAQVERQEAPLEHEETLCHCESAQAGAQGAQRGAGDSILGELQAPGHGPAQPAVGGPAWAGAWTRRPPQVPDSLSPSVIAIAEEYKVSENM